MLEATKFRNKNQRCQGQPFKEKLLNYLKKNFNKNKRQLHHNFETKTNNVCTKVSKKKLMKVYKKTTDVVYKKIPKDD